MMHPTTFLLSALLLASGAQSTSQQTTAQQAVTHDHHAQMNHRGAQVMGFDQDKTTHHFLLFHDGGAIDVSVKDAADKVNLDAIRAHLPQIATKFGQGDFGAPAEVHATEVPGTKDLAALKAKVAWKYVETAKGGRVDIVTTDPAALSAVHAFLKYQIEDHKTGDAVTVVRRPVK
jgi:hypothetical protein